MRTGMVGTLIGGCVFALIGFLVAFYLGKPILDDAKASTAWPSVEGIVEQSEVVTSKGSESKTMYAADVNYRYAVAGQELRGNKVSFGGDWKSGSSSDAYAVKNRYPAGKNVKVFYNPDAPEQSVLEPGATWKSYLLFGIGLLFLIVGLMMVVGPACLLAMGTVMVAGAASGLVGKRKGRDQQDWPQPRPYEAPAKRSAPPRRHDSKDDGFDIA